jgi:hypothetical protein
MMKLGLVNESPADLTDKNHGAVINNLIVQLAVRLRAACGCMTRRGDEVEPGSGRDVV